MGYAKGDYISSELSPNPAVDIHHIDPKGMGGSSTKDRIENLMAVTREEHIEYGDKKHYKLMLFLAHRHFLEQNHIEFDINYFEEQVKKHY